MSTVLQVAVFSASVALVLLVIWLIPLSFLLYRCARDVARQLDELKADLKQLIHDSRTLVKNINHLTTRANQQFDELGEVVGVVRGWADRADLVVKEVGAAFEGPLSTITRGLKILRQAWKSVLGTRDEEPNPSTPKSGEAHGVVLPHQQSRHPDAE